MFVLVADRNPRQAEAIGELLRRRSHRTVLAVSLHSVRHFLRRAPVDAVIAAASIAGNGADTLVREVRLLQADPILIVAGTLPGTAVEQCLAAGAHDVLPTDPARIAERLEWIARSEQ